MPFDNAAPLQGAAVVKRFSNGCREPQPHRKFREPRSRRHTRESRQDMLQTCPCSRNGCGTGSFEIFQHAGNNAAALVHAAARVQRQGEVGSNRAEHGAEDVQSLTAQRRRAAQSLFRDFRRHQFGGFGFRFAAKAS